jgi:hypothetical protein
MQINFWLAVLSIDIRRFTVGIRKKFKQDLKVSLPLRMANRINRKQQPQQSQWIRHRVLQRGSMIFILIWVILIFYKSCLIVDLLHKNGKYRNSLLNNFRSLLFFL